MAILTTEEQERKRSASISAAVFTVGPQNDLSCSKKGADSRTDLRFPSSSFICVDPRLKKNLNIFPQLTSHSIFFHVTVNP